MMIDLKEKGWINSDKNVKLNSDFFIGTTIQSLGDVKGYTVQIMVMGLAIPSKVVMTNEQAENLEAEIWEAMVQ
jgi:hypothetical protein